MIARAMEWWRGRSLRERVLLGVMGGLLALVVLIYGVALPVERGLAEARAAAGEALDRNAAIRNKVAALRQLPRVAMPKVDLPEAVTATALASGLTLERNQPQGPGRADIAVASASSAALFGWIAALEGRGVVVESVIFRPAQNGGTLSTSVIVKEPGR